MSARRLGILTIAAVVAAIVAGCTPGDAGYPAGWAPLAAGPHGCAALAGYWRVHAPGDQDDGMGVLTHSDLANPRQARVGWEVVSVVPDADGQGLTLQVVQHARPPRFDAVVLKRHVVIDSRLCNGGLSTVERHETGASWTAYKLGQDTEGRLVAQRMTHVEGQPLIRWGDTTALDVGRSTTASWSRWQPITEAAFAAAVAQAGLRPARDRSPFGTTPSPFTKPPELPIPPPPPTRPGGLSFGEAQAVVFSALPDTAVYEDMTPTPQGYRLRVHSGDAKDVEQLAQRLAKDGHFELRPTGAAGSAAVGAEVTLELVEHGLVR